MKNWKTTLIGALLGGFIAIQPLFEAGNYDWKKLGLGFAIAVFGYLAKDAGVTGTGK